MRADKRIPKSFDNAQEYSYLEYFFLNECVAQVYKELRESDKFITATIINLQDFPWHYRNSFVLT